MDSIFRRKSGIYFARLVVPARLRQILRKTELIASTGLRDFALAKIVGAELLCSWRRRFAELDRLAVDIVQLKIGSPALSSQGFLPLTEAAGAAGLDVDFLLREARAKRLRLYCDPGFQPGFVVPFLDLSYDQDEGAFDVPAPADMPLSAVATNRPGMLRLGHDTLAQIADDLEAGKPCPVPLFELPRDRIAGFAPAEPVKVDLARLMVAVPDVEALRSALAAAVTEEQIAEARARRSQPAISSKANRHTSEAVTAYMAERGKSCSEDQARRVRAACDLFVELMDDPVLCEVDRDAVRRYRDELLPLVPAHENKVRLQYKTNSIKESIAAVGGTNWPRISAAEQAKRMQWVCGMFEWLLQEKWIPDDPAVGLATVRQHRKGRSDYLKRDLFTRDDLKKIFGAPWFSTGRGELTKAGTYREFLPSYYWLPLLGLFTGARMNELCQLSLSDIRQTSEGVWFIDFNQDDDKGKKRLKNANSSRYVPVHSLLLSCGLIEWRNRLEAEGYDRLFPEFSHNNIKGYSKAAVKWFSSYLRGLGWERNGRKVFHSFRHTLASECLNVLGLSEALTAQISGHARSQSVLGGTYRKDVAPDEVVASVERLDFNLPPIAVFDVPAGLMAVKDALDRKDRRASAKG